jgi:hypothetical protein
LIFAAAAADDHNDAYYAAALASDAGKGWRSPEEWKKREVEFGAMEWQLRAADALAVTVDEAVQRGSIGSRSKIADARLDYGEPYKSRKRTDAGTPLLAWIERAAKALESYTHCRHFDGFRVDCLCTVEAVEVLKGKP